MILGIGNDIVQIDRIEKALKRSGEKFEERCFTAYERKKANSRKNSGMSVVAATYAKRFAAKEACAKALGCGFAEGVKMCDIGVIEDENGRPLLSLEGGAQKRLQALTPTGYDVTLHLSLSDDYPVAQAFVIIEAVNKIT